MARVHVAHFKTGALARESSRAKRGKRAQMLELGENVFLRHKLRELVCGEKFFDTRLQRFGRNKLHRQSDIRIYSGHAVLNVALDLRHTDAYFLLEQLAHETNAAASEVVNIVFQSPRSSVEIRNMV